MLGMEETASTVGGERTDEDVIIPGADMRHLDLHATLVEIESLGKGVICEIHI